MHATRRLYVKQWEYDGPDERYTVKIAYGGKPVKGIQSKRISAVEEEVMCWRKVNHIHAWFVDNVQEGEDDCRSYHVEWDKLRELVALCEKVIGGSELVDGMVFKGTRWEPGMTEAKELRDPGKVIKDPTVAKKLLPTREGFFFGSTEYDQYYLDDVYKTKAWAKRMLKDLEDGVPGYIHYESSW